mmetsp:Transcript_9371/g.17314  ORF Transcript_9371/g.17314 Transcript_9371/m.17314 type:complete len:202 (-) Transcript_9371:192-797(-)
MDAPRHHLELLQRPGASIGRTACATSGSGQFCNGQADPLRAHIACRACAWRQPSPPGTALFGLGARPSRPSFAHAELPWIPWRQTLLSPHLTPTARHSPPHLLGHAAEAALDNPLTAALAKPGRSLLETDRHRLLEPPPPKRRRYPHSLWLAPQRPLPPLLLRLHLRQVFCLQNPVGGAPCGTGCCRSEPHPSSAPTFSAR